jgi:hypothetical protein
MPLVLSSATNPGEAGWTDIDDLIAAAGYRPDQDLDWEASPALAPQAALGQAPSQVPPWRTGT